MKDSDTANATTCPDWCTIDHAARSASQRAQYDKLIESGHLEDDPATRADLDRTIVEQASTHELVFVQGDEPFVALTASGEQPAQVFLGLGFECKEMTSEAARTLAAGLLAAADKADQVAAA